MQKLINLFIAGTILFHCFGCAQINNAGVTYISSHPEKISFMIQEITKLVIKETSPSKVELEKVKDFLIECKALAKNPNELVMDKIKLLSQNIQDSRAKIIVLNIINFADRYINSVNSKDNRNLLIIIVCDSALKVIENEIK